MITIPISITVDSGGTAPYNFTFLSNDSNVTFDNASVTAIFTSGKYRASTNVLYPDQSYISTTTISATVTDGNGCEQTISPIVINNPCNLQSTIVNNGEFVFVAATSGGSGSYTYEWIYDDELFEPNQDIDLTDKSLSLKLKTGVSIPVSTPINVYITDSNGCTLYKTFTYTFCKPTVQPGNLDLVCTGVSVLGCPLEGTYSTYRNYDLKPLITLCSNQVINWDTLSFTVPDQYCAVHHGNGIISIGSSKNIGFTALIYFNVKTTSGILVENYLTVNTPICSLRTNFSGTPTTFQITADYAVSDTVVLDVEPRVSGTPDWSTFTITNTPSWGTVILNGARQLVYTITDLTTTPAVPDVIKWSLQDTNGNQINITDTLLRDVIAAPVTVTETICSSCGQVVGPHDVLANDTGDIDRSTLTIVSADPQIIITKDSDNNLTFTTLPGASFNNLNVYKVANTQGVFSADQNFIVRAACVGSNRTPTKNLTCIVSKTFNIIDQFTNTNAFGVIFAETGSGTPYTVAGGTIVGANGTLDFTGIPNGTYEFQMTAQNQGTCSPTYDDIGTLTVIHGVTPHVTLGVPSLVSAGIYSFTFTYSGIVSAFSVSDDGVPASFQTSLTTNSGTGSFTLYAASGSNIVISATTECGNIVTDTVTL